MFNRINNPATPNTEEENKKLCHRMRRVLDRHLIQRVLSFHPIFKRERQWKDMKNHRIEMPELHFR